MEVIGFTLIIVTAVVFSIIGVLYTRGKKISIEGFIVSRGSVKLNVAIATSVASSMGAWILFSPSETSSVWGITALIGYALGSALALIIFAWLGLKFRQLMPKGHTLTEYVFHRYGTGMYVLILLITVFYMAVFLAAELTGISLAAKIVFDIPLIYTAAIIGIATVTYTAFGGIKSSIFTDRFQHMIFLPLIIVIFLVSVFLIGNIGSFADKVNKANPNILNFGYKPGIEMAFTLIIAIVAANLFHQGYWQRVYVSKTHNIMKKSFLISGLIVFFVVLVAGSFGVFAVGLNSLEYPSVSLFTFLLGISQPFVIFAVMILAVALVMSSMDTLLNGLVSVFTTDLARLKPKINKKKILNAARWITVVLAGITILVAKQGYSVLYLFLVADLICSGAAFPTFYGLFSKKHSGIIAFIASISGIIAGLFFFPDPTFSRGNLLYSFLIALVVSSIITLLLCQFSKRKFDFRTLQKKIVLLSK